LIDKAFDMIDNLASRYRTAVPATIGDDAKGAAMFAAGLYLDKSTGLAIKGRGQMGCSLAHGHDV
jgi:hypothetical protein